MSTISVRPLTCLLERGAGLPALQVAVEVTEHADGVRLLLNDVELCRWPASVARGVARIPEGEQSKADGLAVRVTPLSAGALVTVLVRGRFLFSVQLGPDGALGAACVERGEPGMGSTTG